MNDIEPASKALPKHDWRVTMLLRKAAEDYAACRCCLQNGLFSGLELGASAVEKMLKALHIATGLPKRSFRHKTDLIVEALLPIYPSLASFEEVFGKLRCHYESRYPDSEVHRSASTDEVNDIDVVILAIHDLIPIEEDSLIRSGIFAGLFAIIVNSMTLPEWVWISRGNRPLSPRIPAMVDRIRELHPASTSTLGPSQ